MREREVKMRAVLSSMRAIDLRSHSCSKMTKRHAHLRLLIASHVASDGRGVTRGDRGIEVILLRDSLRVVVCNRPRRQGGSTWLTGCVLVATQSLGVCPDSVCSVRSPVPPLPRPDDGLWGRSCLLPASLGNAGWRQGQVKVRRGRMTRSL